MTVKTLTIIGIILFLFSFKPLSAPVLYPELQTYIKNVTKDFDKIPKERKVELKKIAEFVKSKLSTEQKAELLFVCTHNSRRSHMSQLWAKAAAEYYAVSGVNTFSGGTEASAFNPRAVKAMTKAGFKITKTTEEKNPLYEIKYAETAEPLQAFSKKYTEFPNPKSNFVAVMTCSKADKSCPLISGASLRVSIPYDDPKEFDGQAIEEAKYDERCKQIATEMLYIFSKVK